MFRLASKKRAPSWFKSTTEELVAFICNDDFTKFKAAYKLKISDAIKLLIINEKKNYLQWREAEELKQS